MCVYPYVHIHVYIYICIYEYIYTYTYIYIYIYIYTNIYIFIQKKYVYIFAFLFRIYIIEAAPRKPTPDGIAAATLAGSQACGPVMKEKAEAMVKEHEPSDMMAMVLCTARKIIR